jgi:hypothetical protein
MSMSGEAKLDEDDDLDDVDADALRRAMDIQMRNPLRAAQLREKLADEPWRHVAEFAAVLCQADALRLKPWEAPPALAYVVHGDGCGGKRTVRDPQAGPLLDRMTEAGLSQWEPNPLLALDKKNSKG